jgi:hypothetical protein
VTVVNADLADWSERAYISQYGMPPLTLTIRIGGVPADPDGQNVGGQLVLQNGDGSTTTVNTYTAARANVGEYTITPSSGDTATPSNAYLSWAYSIAAKPEQYVSMLEIGRANPSYDSLPLAMQEFIEVSIWPRFAECFDSPSGGPNLQTYFQSKWSRGRVAQMMAIALAKINAEAQPFSIYSLDGSTGPVFPIQLWGGLLASYTYIECVKQLIRGYTEQPALMGGGVTRFDRRDYTQRWRENLQDEQGELKSLLDVFKIRHMGLGNPRVLVSGGTYGRYAPTRIAGSVAARPRMWARWY